MRGRYFLYALIVITFLALLEYPPRTPAVISGATPVNTGWDGTSYFLGLLRSEGYQAYVVTNWCDAFRGLSSVNKSVVVVIISPEMPYSKGEVDCISAIIHESLSRWGSASVLIADEGPYTKPVLTQLGIDAEILSGLLAKSVNGDPFPVAVLKVPEAGAYTLVLNYASKLESWGGARVAGKTLKGDEVAAYEVKGGLRAYVVSDGSVFINELMTLNTTKYDYRGFAKAVMSWLCPSRSCAILIEGAKYGSSLNSLVNSLKAAALSGAGLEKLAALVVAMLHPMVWFPVLHNILLSADLRLRELMLSNEVFRLSSVGVAVLAVLYIIGRVLGLKGSVSDSPLPGVSEVDIIVDTPIRREVVAGKVRLSKEDVPPLYDIVDEVFRRTVGKGLEDPEVAQAVAAITGLDPARVSRFVERLRKLNDKVRRGKFFPIVIFWGRSVRSLILEADEILKRLGTALSEGVGVEKIIRRY